jgi:hypothetical protein
MNRSHLKTLLLALPLLIFNGCVSPNGGPNLQVLPTTMTFDATKEQIWPVLMDQIAMRYPVRTIEKVSGLLATDYVNLRVGYNNAEMKNYAIAPRLILPTWNGLRVSLKTLVTEPAPGKSTVQIKAQYEAYENNVYNTWVACESNGGLENQLLKSIYAKLQSPDQAKRVDSH